MQIIIIDYKNYNSTYDHIKKGKSFLSSENKEMTYSSVDTNKLPLIYNKIIPGSMSKVVSKYKEPTDSSFADIRTFSFDLNDTTFFQTYDTTIFDGNTFKTFGAFADEIDAYVTLISNDYKPYFEDFIKDANVFKFKITDLKYDNGIVRVSCDDSYLYKPRGSFDFSGASGSTIEFSKTEKVDVSINGSKEITIKNLVWNRKDSQKTTKSYGSTYWSWTPDLTQYTLYPDQAPASSIYNMDVGAWIYSKTNDYKNINQTDIFCIDIINGSGKGEKYYFKFGEPFQGFAPEDRTFQWIVPLYFTKYSARKFLKNASSFPTLNNNSICNIYCKKNYYSLPENFDENNYTITTQDDYILPKDDVEIKTIDSKKYLIVLNNIATEYRRFPLSFNSATNKLKSSDLSMIYDDDLTTPASFTFSSLYLNFPMSEKIYFNIDPGLSNYVNKKQSTEVDFLFYHSFDKGPKFSGDIRMSLVDKELKPVEFNSDNSTKSYINYTVADGSNPGEHIVSNIVSAVDSTFTPITIYQNGFYPQPYQTLDFDFSTPGCSALCVEFRKNEPVGQYPLTSRQVNNQAFCTFRIYHYGLLVTNSVNLEDGADLFLNNTATGSDLTLHEGAIQFMGFTSATSVISAMNELPQTDATITKSTKNNENEFKTLQQIFSESLFCGSIENRLSGTEYIRVVPFYRSNLDTRLNYKKIDNSLISNLTVERMVIGDYFNSFNITFTSGTTNHNIRTINIDTIRTEYYNNISKSDMISKHIESTLTVDELLNTNIYGCLMQCGLMSEHNTQVSHKDLNFQFALKNYNQIIDMVYYKLLYIRDKKFFINLTCRDESKQFNLGDIVFVNHPNVYDNLKAVGRVVEANYIPSTDEKELRIQVLRTNENLFTDNLKEYEYLPAGWNGDTIQDNIDFVSEDYIIGVL